MKNIIGITGIITALGFPIAWLWSDRSFFTESDWYTNSLFWLLVVSLTPIVTILVYAGYRAIKNPTKKNIDASAGTSAMIWSSAIGTVLSEINIGKGEKIVLLTVSVVLILAFIYWASTKAQNTNNASKRTESTRSAHLNVE